MKRFEFNLHYQREDESIATYVVELRKLAEHCNFGTALSDMLRDKLVCGIRQKSMHWLLCESELTYDEALEMPQAAESPDKDAQ